MVFKGILANLSNREIADQMQNSTRTIETHRAKIFKKMKVTSAIELAQIHERFVLRGGQLPF
jgi:two-component system response regulator DctR